MELRSNDLIIVSDPYSLPHTLFVPNHSAAQIVLRPLLSISLVSCWVIDQKVTTFSQLHQMCIRSERVGNILLFLFYFIFYVFIPCLIL